MVMGLDDPNSCVSLLSLKAWITNVFGPLCQKVFVDELFDFEFAIGTNLCFGNVTVFWRSRDW